MLKKKIINHKVFNFKCVSIKSLQIYDISWENLERDFRAKIFILCYTYELIFVYFNLIPIYFNLFHLILKHFVLIYINLLEKQNYK